MICWPPLRALTSHASQSTSMQMPKQTNSIISQDALSHAISFIFSWIILLAIGVIVSGKLLSQRLKLKTGAGQVFRIPVKGVLIIEANGAEVVLGFTFYLLSVFALGATSGVGLQSWVRVHYGIDPGQFNALGFISSLVSVAVSFVVYLVAAIPASVFGRRSVARHDSLLDKITREKTGLDPNKLPEVKQ
jgi:hypothetical protein